MRTMLAGAIPLMLSLLGVCSATAAQITIGPSDQNITFSPAGVGLVDVEFGTCEVLCTLTGPAILLHDPLVETYELTVDPAVAIRFGPGNGMEKYPVVVPIGANTRGTFAPFFGINVISLTYTYQDLWAASPNVQFTGGIRLGAYFDFDLQRLTCENLRPGQACTIGSIAADYSYGDFAAKAFAPISSGEFVLTPEPGTMLLLGAGLGILAFWRPRRQQ